MPTPTPTGDDVAFLTFGVVAEAALARLYHDAGRLRGAFSAGERRVLVAASVQHRGDVDVLNAALGPADAIKPGTFTGDVVVRSRDGALRVVQRLERLLVGVYLSGVGYVADPGSRLLLGRLLGVAARHEALALDLSGGIPDGLPAPIGLAAAGSVLDRYITETSA